MKRFKRNLALGLILVLTLQIGMSGGGFAAANMPQPAPEKLRVEAPVAYPDEPPIGYNEFYHYYADLKCDPLKAPDSPSGPNMYLNYYQQAINKPYKPASPAELAVENVPAETAVGTNNEARLKELQSGTIYYAYSRAYYTYTTGTTTYTSPESQASNTVKFMTDIAIDAFSYGPNQIKIVWDDVWNSGKRMDYKLYVSENKDFTNTPPIYIGQAQISQNGPVTVNEATGKLEYIHTVRDPGRVYYIKIAPDTTETELKKSKESPTVAVSSFILAKTTKMSVTSNGDAIWKLEWSPVVTGLADSSVKVTYQIYKGSTNGNNLEQYMASVDDTQFFLTVKKGDVASYYIIKATVTRNGEDLYPNVKIQSANIYVKDSEVPSTPAAPELVDEFQNAGSTIISYKDSLKPDSATILWKVPKNGSGAIDENVSYDIWLINDPNLIKDPPDSMLVASDIKMNNSNYVMGGTNLLGYKFVLDDLTPNSTYYFKIVAKKSYIEFVDNVLQNVTLESEASMKVVITPTNGPIDQPVIPGTPPLKLKQDRQGVDMVSEDSAVIELQNKWYEEFVNGKWTYKTPDQIVSDADTADKATILDHLENGTLTPEEALKFRKVEYDDGVTIDVGCTEYEPGMDYGSIEELSTNKIIGVSVAPNDPDEYPDNPAPDAIKDGKKHNIIINVGDLEPNATYVIWVRAARTSVNLISGPSDPIIITTIPHIGSTIEKPTVPAFNYEEAADTYVDLGWNFNFAYTYYIKYGTVDDISRASDSVTVTPDDLKYASYYRVSGLDPDTLYYFWIQAEASNEEGDTAQSEWSDSISVKTLAEAPPDTPKGFGVKNTKDAVTKDSITYEWLPEDGMEYILEVGTDLDYKNAKTYNISSGSEYTVTGLRSNFRYYARLYAYDQGKELKSEPTQSIIVRTLRSSDDYDSSEDVENVISGSFIDKEPIAINHIWKISITGVNADRFVEHVQTDNKLDYLIDLTAEPSGTEKISLTVSGKVFHSLSMLGENLMVESDRNTLVFRPGTLDTAMKTISDDESLDPSYVIGLVLNSNTNGSNIKNLSFKTPISALDLGLAEGGQTIPVLQFAKPLKLIYGYTSPDWYKDGSTAGYTLSVGGTQWQKAATKGSYDTDAARGTLSFETAVTGRLAVAEQGRDYYDDISGSWARDSIANVASVHKLNAIPGSSFKPEKYVTNGEAAKLMLDMVDYGYGANYMAQALKAGLIGSADSQKPTGNITREKFISMAMRLLEIKTSEKASLTSGGAGIYKDMSQVSSSLLPRIRFAAENGIITSRFSDTLGPKDPVTRAEAMVLLEKVLKYAGEL